MKKQILLFISLFIVSIFTLSAKITMAKVFTDNMVLQQQTDASLWGKARPNKAVKVTTSWNNQVYTTTADAAGKWKLSVKTPVAGGPYFISITDGKELRLNNILIGEVWICSGQSNMEMPLAGWGEVQNFKQEIASADYPQIRLLHVEKATSNEPLDDLKMTRNGWQVCSPETVADFSSVAYFFGRNLNQELNVPVGLISTSWGGTIAEAWTSSEALENMPDFKDAALEIKNTPEQEQEARYKANLDTWNQNILLSDKGFTNETPVWASINMNDTSWPVLPAPKYWEQSNLKVDGIVWLRKTINIPAGWAGNELTLKLAMIDDNDETYYNGVKVGETTGYNVQRQYKVPANLVKEGKAVITVRVIDTGGDGGFHGDAADMTIKPASQNDEISLAGDWKYQVAIDFHQLGYPPRSPINNANRPTVLFNAMIHPLVPYAIKGAIWYQGEANADRAYQYRELLPLMIRDWRKQWNSEFPFYLVQLANYMERKNEPQESEWAELREAQLQTLNLENTGMAVTIDIGEARDIHPKNKQDVGLRLALNARANTYGEKIAFSGPLYKSYKIEGDKIRISFTNTNNGLRAADGKQLKGFAIAGPDHVFKWANAVIDGNEVVVSLPGVEFPVAVRYAWGDNPACNLSNGAGLPASPFRTDDWR